MPGINPDVLATATVVLPNDVANPVTLPSSGTPPPPPALAINGFAESNDSDIPTGKNANELNGSKTVKPPTA
jgi:hypothetical protein